MSNTVKLTSNLKYEYCLFGFSLISVLFYTFCATPSIGWRDGPELVVTATYLDVAHPAGFPTYNLLAKFLTWLPLGSLGFRVTLFSALASGAAVFLLGLLARKIHLLDKATPPSLIWLFAGFPWFVMYQGVWSASVEVEVYSLNILFIVVLLYCATSWFEGRGIFFLYFGGFIYGLACGNHGSLALYLPVFLILTFWGQPKNNINGQIYHQSQLRILILSIVFIIGISVYLLLIVRSLTDSLPLDFGNTKNLTNFWYHITDGKDRGVHVQAISNLDQFLFYLKQQINNITSNLIWLIVPFVLWSLKYLWDNYQIFSVAIVLLIIINIVFFYYWIDGISAFLPSVMVGFLLMFLGLGQFGRFLSRLKVPGPVSITGAILVAVIGLAYLGHQRLDERETEAGFWATELFWPDLTKLPPESVSLYNENWFFILAIKHIYLIRPDANVMFLPAFTGSRYIQPLSPRKYPMAAFPRAQDGEGYLPATTDSYLSHFINANLDAGKKVYIQYTDDEPIGSILNFTRISSEFMWLAEIQRDSGAAFKGYKDGEYDRYLNWVNRFMINLGKSIDPPLARKSSVNVYYCLRPVVAYAFRFGEYVLTEKAISTFINTFTDRNGKLMFPYDMSLNAHIFIINNLMLQNKDDEARDAMEKFIELDPSISYSYYILALIYEKTNKQNEAFKYIEKAMKMDPYDEIYMIQYAKYLAKYYSISLADNFLKKRSQFLVSKRMLNTAKIVNYYNSCLFVAPEDDTAGDSHNLSIIDKYSLEVFQ